MCAILDNRDRGAMRVGGTSRVELSEELEGQPTTTRLTLDHLDGAGTIVANVNLSIHKGTIIHHPKQL